MIRQLFVILAAMLAMYGYEHNQTFETTGIIALVYFVLAVVFNASTVTVNDDDGKYIPLISGIYNAIFGVCLAGVFYAVCSMNQAMGILGW